MGIGIYGIKADADGRGIPAGKGIHLKFLYACLGLGKLDRERAVGSVHGFTLTAFFNTLSQQYMEHETYGKEAAWVVVDGAGKLVVDNVRNGFDQEVKKRLEEYLHPSQPEEEEQEKIQKWSDPAEQEKPLPYREENSPDKPRLDSWQKYMENGEYLRSAEISEEQNYNMIDGRKNNGYKAPSDRTSMPSPKKPKGRQSVLAKLHKKQAEIAERSGKKERQAVTENDMERERK